MDSQYLQYLRYQLQKRFRRLNSCRYFMFHTMLIQFWNYLQSQSLYQGILAKYEAETPPYEEEIKAITSEHEIADFDTEQKQNGFIYRIIQFCITAPDVRGFGPEVTMGRAISHKSKHDEALDEFRELFLEPFYEFLDEALDQQAMTLSLLLKYKRKVEWFEREELLKTAGENERHLAKHLYASLFDQGLDFHIEPQSISGEADLVAKDLILDAKVFDGERRGIAYLASGVHQVHTYARDYNQEVGYLLVYKTCPETIDFAWEIEDQSFPSIKVGGKVIYIVVVDICDHQATASKRGTLKVFNVTEDLLIRAADQEN